MKLTIQERARALENLWEKHPVIVLLNLPDDPLRREEMLMFRIVQLQHRVDMYQRDNALMDERAELLRERNEQLRQLLIDHRIVA